MADAIEIKLEQRLPDLTPEEEKAMKDALLSMYQRGFDDAKEVLCKGCGYKCYYKQMAAQGDCNDCAKKYNCQYVPRPGGIVRINCPLWRAEG